MNRHSNGFIIFLIVILTILGGGILLLNSSAFERNAPVIEGDGKVFWNLKDPLKITISDDVGIHNYRVYMLRDGERTLLENLTLDKKPASVSFELTPPKNAIFKGEKLLEFEIEVTDTSNWNLFSGNSSNKKITAIIDTKRPSLQIVSHSYKITKGGAALVIFKVEDEFLANIEISNGFETFTARPFYKDGYYASLITWSLMNKDFNAKISASDMAGNTAVASVNFFKVQKNYRESKLQLKDSFIDGKISALVEEINERPLTSFVNKVDIFKYINEEIRGANEDVIAQVGLTENLRFQAHEFSPLPFYPLRNGAAVASFGDHRFFEYGGAIVSESYHMGLDLASTQNAPIVSSNAGEIMFVGFLGIYGNSAIIDHGMGLMTLYSHMAEIHVQKGNVIPAGTIIGKTGATGLALGDHLHFGIIIQGREVSCVEWMDAKWIKESITDVIKSARNLIDTQGK